MTNSPLIVLDDDPTGTQAVADVPVLFDWDCGRLREVADGDPKAVFLLTNTRAVSPGHAREIVRGGAEAAVGAFGRPRIVLRGDSTLRGHLLEEYEALCDVAFPDRTPPLLLVPALPHAGRVTRDGVHYIVRNGIRIPLHETEYAADPAFGYHHARLLDWASERSGGRFAADAGCEVHLEQIRSEDGADTVSAALLELAASAQPSVCVPDAETVEDLAVIADGLRDAEAAGAEVVVRSGPTFVGVLAGALATEAVVPPVAERGLLVIFGSWVPLSTQQLGELTAARPGSLIEVDVLALASSDADDEIGRAAEAARERLRRGGLAVIATGRERPEEVATFEAGERIAANLASVLHRLDLESVVVLAKGGVTSAITARHGLRAWRADVIGPLAEGIALWRVHGARGDVPYVVFPGNVGSDRTLLEVVELILAS